MFSFLPTVKFNVFRSFASAACGSIILTEAALACPEPPNNLMLASRFAEPERHSVHVQGIWAIWHETGAIPVTEARYVADYLQSVRCDSIVGLGLNEPPNLQYGQLVNIYIHDPERDDGFDDAWSNGVGSHDEPDIPYMTLPIGAHLDPANLAHEGFHIFQFNGNSPGFAYEGDTGWFTEATANWFSVRKEPDAEDAYATIGSIVGNPHLALWHGFDNAQNGDPIHWMTETRQYGLHIFLNYLTEYAGLPDAALTSGFIAGTNQSPQEYLASQIGRDRFGNAWADFAAYLAASYVGGDGSPMPDWFLTDVQRQYAFEERRWLVHDDPIPDIENDIAATVDIGDGAWTTPPKRLRPRPWSFNVVDVKDPKGKPLFEIAASKGSSTRTRLAVLKSDAWTVSSVSAGDRLDLEGADRALIIVAPTPNQYSGHTPFDYRLRLLDE